jgi:hypothetical protein
VKIIAAALCLFTSCVGLISLRSAPLLGAPQQGSSAGPAVPPRRSKATKPTGHIAAKSAAHRTRKPIGYRATKPTWHSGPAATPLETEIVPSRPPAAPPRVATTLDSSTNMKTSAAVRPQATGPTRSVRATSGPPAVSGEQALTANGARPDSTSPSDPEAERIQDEFARLCQDAAARHAFYDDLLGTVARVRADMKDENAVEEKPVSFQPAASPSRTTSIELVNPPHLPEFNAPPAPPPTKPAAPQSSLGPNGSRFDRVAYQRVVRWAKSNGTPVQLALGVAWMESRLNANPPRGAAGEVGMFQIMPERCRLEGWPPQRLSEPDFNAWIGTMLLARYYQEEGSVERAAQKYVAGPGVFNKKYSPDIWAYINWYATTVDSYASYFSLFQG